MMLSKGCGSLQQIHQHRSCPSSLTLCPNHPVRASPPIFILPPPQPQRQCTRSGPVVAAAAAAPAAAPAAAAPAAAAPPANQTGSGGAITTSGIVYHDPKWNSVQNEQQFFSILEASLAGHPMAPKLLMLWRDFYSNYSRAVLGSKVPGADEKLVAQVQASIADNVLLQFRDPYTFPSFHQRMITPTYSYFEFGQRYVASLTDFANSVLGHRKRWDQAAAQLAAGENVVLLANHQTEADPGVFAHMLMSVHPSMAEEVVYVAGDRVVTDPMCKPFSMGRNLFCVHSKKHLNDIPEQRAAKMETNRKTLFAMQRSLNNGGMLIWIAPSGGRDRPNAEGKWIPDKFDPAAVELMRSLAARAKKPSHIYPMAMFSWPMMPPPKTIDKDIGERRITNWTPVGISLCEELDVSKVLSGIDTDDKEQQQKALAETAHRAALAEYEALHEAIFNPSKRGPGTPYTQPWMEFQTNAQFPPARRESVLPGPAISGSTDNSSSSSPSLSNNGSSAAASTVSASDSSSHSHSHSSNGQGSSGSLADSLRTILPKYLPTFR
ncbi:hypothetical protein DUNSADRAFT_8476 [Dunaliella salina]|uniref:glycerol-3-phosphate 1-O-acyltransferase n=1 Tax=Dunaliella salina TaxID=3046 RepID=A0ABQ7GJI9_DUNSA|nr:hypothetical protein DUNSADRAFT_8476 [Dunaliella salina]|eukprot:KAF5834749.1 hypothetical protein DUNSADRAFT_8476 [Dunaliella salina]